MDSLGTRLRSRVAKDLNTLVEEFTNRIGKRHVFTPPGVKIRSR